MIAGWAQGWGGNVSFGFGGTNQVWTGGGRRGWAWRGCCLIIYCGDIKDVPDTEKTFLARSGRIGHDWARLGTIWLDRAARRMAREGWHMAPFRQAQRR